MNIKLIWKDVKRDFWNFLVLGHLNLDPISVADVVCLVTFAVSFLHFSISVVQAMSVCLFMSFYFYNVFQSSSFCPLSGFDIEEYNVSG